MSIIFDSEKAFNNFDDDLWFDAPEELFMDALENQEDEIFDVIELHAYVANPEENHFPEIPTVVLQKRIEAFYSREPAPFEEDDPNLQKLFEIQEALQSLQYNHTHAMGIEDKRFQSIISRLDEATNRPYDPENIQTHADLKRERVLYARRLNEVTRTQELLEREYRVEMMELEKQAVAIGDAWDAHQKMLAEQQQKVAENLVIEDRIRLGILKQKHIEQYNLELQDIVTNQFNKIRELEDDYNEAREELNKGPFIYHPVSLKDEEQIHAEANDTHGQLQESVPDSEASTWKIENVAVPSDQREPSEQNSYHHELQDEDDVGRLYALYSRDSKKRNFALAKFFIDLQKRHEDENEQRAHPAWEVHDFDFAQDWINSVPDNVHSPEASPVVDPAQSTKRTFSDYEKEEKVAEQQGRKRLRPVSLISRTPTPPVVTARALQKPRRSSQATDEDLGYYGYDGLYYAHDG
ncbi:hypothetical protein SBOR_9180 [Sclerotinia borealis F-4128]|uniref:Uncharacterized protein n=1 Tax=Sclerotinia borealis (strain F-4128) TaxID=1432307 RepID=W9C0V8_SCLBF|nr:hypothetical protein SBOR_9180 [Sclerotinia borealis F-4128]